ncbi:hypothetical protein AZ702_09740 [Campylobacter coli]|nr:hypothetical protein [Campylobacter coli]
MFKIEIFSKNFNNKIRKRKADFDIAFLKTYNSAVNIAKICGDLWLSHIFEKNRLLKIQKMNITL